MKIFFSIFQKNFRLLKIGELSLNNAHLVRTQNFPKN